MRPTAPHSGCFTFNDLSGTNRNLSLMGFLLVMMLAPSVSAQTVYSDLWGEKGELWDQSADGRLQDFTSVGYKNGTERIPDWPVGVNVLDFGAVPNDGNDDSQAFIDAIAACPDRHAIFVPAGRYTIHHRIKPKRDHFVLRGENMYETVLFFPMFLNEAELQEDGYSSDAQKSTGADEGFIRMEGGTEKSIENLTLEFREQAKGSHHDFMGAYGLAYVAGITNSWVRNVQLRNMDQGLTVESCQNNSFINIVFDHWFGSPSIEGTTGVVGFDGHIGITTGASHRNLFHNIDFRHTKFYHSIDLIGNPTYNVFSNITGTNRVHIHHHGRGADHNLYTNVHSAGMDEGISDIYESQEFETHWGISGYNTFVSDAILRSEAGNHVWVGYNADFPETITSTLYFEKIDHANLHPKNIYLAQLAFKDMPLPSYDMPTEPTGFTGSVIRIRPTDVNDTDKRNPDTPTDTRSVELHANRENFYTEKILKFPWWTRYVLNTYTLSTYAKPSYFSFMIDRLAWWSPGCTAWDLSLLFLHFLPKFTASDLFTRPVSA